MKKVLVLALMCVIGAAAFTSCKKDNADPTETTEPVITNWTQNAMDQIPE